MTADLKAWLPLIVLIVQAIMGIAGTLAWFLVKRTIQEGDMRARAIEEVRLQLGDVKVDVANRASEYVCREEFAALRKEVNEKLDKIYSALMTTPHSRARP